MSNQRERLVKMVEEEDISSIQLMSGRLQLASDEVRTLLQQLVDEGILDGYLTEDGERFFKRKVEVSDKPIVPTEKDEEVDFLEFDSRPGKVISFIGLLVVIASAVGFITAPDLRTENIFSVVFFGGLLIISAGCYYIGSRKTIS